jgi:uncharacterized membrane protein YgcG
MFRRLLIFLTLFGAPLCAPPRGLAQTESILDYHSDITIDPDTSLHVTETITVLANNKQIRHGIYRDFPTTYSDYLGNRYAVGFRLLGATRDGAPETTRLADLSNGQRIYLGQENFLLPAGRHTYTIDYLTTRQLGFFKDHDELFWNVTGNGWGFTIRHASATVHLPAFIPASEVRLSGFTGRQGSEARDLTSATNDDATFSFAANSPLHPREGLTILLSWPKGFIAEPTVQQKLKMLLDDNREIPVVAIGFLVLLLYYVIVWSAVGRDPAAGVIMPIYEPPANLSPAAMRYLVRMGYDNKIFAAAVLDMAVKGYLTIKEQAGSYTLYLTQNGKPRLSPDENGIAETLFSGRTEIWLHNENHTTISSAISSLKAWLKTAEEKIYFVTNSRYLLPAIAITVISLLGAVLSKSAKNIPAAAFACFWLSFWSVAVAGLLIAVSQSWKSAFAGGHAKPSLMGKAFFLTLFSVPFVGGEFLGMFFLAKATSFFVVLFLLANILLHVLFHYLLKAPTRAGRQLLDQVQGFKLFLGAVDGDRLNRANPPDQTPQTFEKFLPYALALDVEQDWAEKFSGILAIAGQTPGYNSSNYSPAWYSGPGWSSLGAAGFASSMGSSFTSAISSSASAPGSSGGGGGGSGGGGGGGGGGGW